VSALNRRLAAAIYFTTFLPYFVIPSPLDAAFLAAYATVIVVSFAALPGNPETPSTSETGRYQGVIIAVALVVGVSMSILPISGALMRGVSKYLAAALIFSSMIPVAGSPFRLSKMGDRVRKKGVEALKLTDETQSAIDHFSLEFSIQRWFHHVDFSYVSVAFLGLYYYGWYLLGLPFLLYSVSLLVLIAIILRTVAMRVLAPYTPQELVELFESAPRRKSKLLYSGPRTTVVTICVLSFLAFASLVQNPFLSKDNFLLFVGLAVVNALFLTAYAATSRWGCGRKD